jgi:hypothetical protein
MESSDWLRMLEAEEVADRESLAQGVHFAASVAGAPLEPSTVPTAMQKNRLGQETSLRAGTWSPFVGIDSSCQLAPSKRSANVPKLSATIPMPTA